MKDETQCNNDLEFIIKQHQKEIWEYKKKESEWEETKNQLEGTKQIVNRLTEQVSELKYNNKVLKDELERLAEENTNIRIVHQTMHEK